MSPVLYFSRFLGTRFIHMILSSDLQKYYLSRPFSHLSTISFLLVIVGNMNYVYKLIKHTCIIPQD